MRRRRVQLSNDAELLEGINWNAIEDEKDKDVWEKLTSNFWLDTKIPLSNDIPSWNTFTEDEKKLTMQVFTGLTLLDTIQGTVGAVSLIPDAITDHEAAVYTNIAFMESVHAKSYSSIFSTLCSTQEIKDTFRWGKENPYLQKKARIIVDFYQGGDPLKRKIASTLLESFLFYSGFYLPLHWSAKAKLTNSADLIRLIIRDECYATGTELLTPFGWIPIENVKQGDEVAQYFEDGTISFAGVERTSQSEVPGVYRFSSEQGHVHQEVSPNHRMYLERRGYGKVSETEYEPEITRAVNIEQTKLNGYARFVMAGELEGSEDELTARDRLLIAIQADGSFDTTTKNANGELRRSGAISGHVPAHFSFSKERKIERLKELAEEAGWDLREGSTSPAKGEVKERRHFTLYVPKDEPRDKLLSSISSFEGKSAAWCREFVLEAAEWDGYRNGARITWGSVVPENAVYLQAVATLAGFRVHYRVRPDDRSETFSDYHRLQIHTESKHAGAQHVVKEWVPGTQTVYGVQVPSGLLVTRNNGTVNISGNSIHGYYIGYKFQKNLESIPEENREEYKNFTYELLYELYENEVLYTQDLYDKVGLTEDVLAFLKYNANKALMNLGYDPLFPKDATNFNPSIMTALTPNSGETHDFFSGAGSSYAIAVTEVTEDEDWDF